MCEHVFVRWDEQAVDREDEGRLPGIGRGTVVRHFDAPEATGINFHEVRAKSVLNHVPGGRYGFNWTINPFRGCTHACVYCLAGVTPILMANGQALPLANLEVGDTVIGTERRGGYRRYAVTQVLAHWETKKEAHRIHLEDGTELVASGDHRFLTDRGWKFVTGSVQGRSRRPHLTTNNKLMGYGGFHPSPTISADYQRGYLCGMIRGDGHLGSYHYQRTGRSHGDVHRFRLALADSEALARTQRYLAGAGITTQEFQFSPATAKHREIRAIRTSALDKVSGIMDLISWPSSESLDWTKGFVAGIFDAEGCCNGVLRISNKDVELIDRIGRSLRTLGFLTTIDGPSAGGVRAVRVLGGVPQQQRLFELTDPAISRKRSIAGVAIKTNAPLRIESIEPLGKRLPMFDITTATGDFIANGVVSHNCFARRTHTYLDFDAGRDFEREIVVKVNTPEVLRAQLARPSWKGELVALGTNTDPYQWAESRYRFMPEIIAALEAARTPVSVLTKSPLVLRDIDLYAEMAKRLDVSVNLSIPTLDESVWRATEPHTPSPPARLEAVARLKERGIGSGVLIAPLMPGINDSPEQVEPLVRMAREAGADFLGGVALHLRDEVRDVFFGWLAAKRPDLLPEYGRLYAGGRAYMTPADRSEATRAVRGWGRGRAGRARRDGGPARRTAGPRASVGAGPAKEQRSLF